MKANVMMKTLSLAVLGLVGMSFAGASMAQGPGCPTNPAAPDGPWTSKSVLGGAIAITTPGLGSTTCKLDASITSTAFGSAFVRDNTPAAETRYRAAFLVDVDALTGLNSIQSVRLLSVNTDTPYLGITEALRVSVSGNLAGTAKVLGIVAGCEGQPSNLCSNTVALPATGTQKVQIEWVKGAAGVVRVWLNNNTEASPNLVLNGNTNGWVVDYTTLGLSNPSPNFRTVQTNRVVKFDEFDSRRTTFIN
jgi:hypothetical protein